MSTNNTPEHFVTLFDYNYLPAGLALYDSLLTHALPFNLWVLCMDEKVEDRLRELNLEHLKLIPLRDVETDALREAKKDRTGGEYCWTMTPFSPEAVMKIDPSIKRVTYLDADLFFFDSPLILLDELSRSNADVLITEHAYAPEYKKWEASAGKYCVQFMTFNNTEAGLKVLHRWQNQCIDWCYARMEDGKFGDQMYLNDCLEYFGEVVHVLEQKDKALAPWNVSYYMEKDHENVPVFYHFHSLKIISSRKIKLFDGYRINQNFQKKIYDRYTHVICKNIIKIKQFGWEIPILPEQWTIDSFLRNLRMRVTGNIQYHKY